MPTVLFVRISSALAPEELDRRLLERRPRFLDVPGLEQKIYGRDPETGDICGIYFFESAQALRSFRDTELARSIPSACPWPGRCSSSPNSKASRAPCATPRRTPGAGG